MARIRKIVKRKLKEPDEFISFSEKALIYVTHHSKTIVTSGIIVLVLILSIFFFQRWEGKKEENAYEHFRLAVESYQIASTPSQEEAVPNYKNALEKFNEVITKFPRTSSGKLAILYKGNIHLRLGEYDDAIKVYEDFLQKAGKEKLFRSFAMEGLGYSYEGKKDYERAIHAYQKSIDLKEDFRLENAYLGMGRCYEKLGKNKEALENYKNFLKISKKSQMTYTILKKISNIEK